MRNLLILALWVPASALAVPMELSHQGRLFDALGAPLDGSNDIEIRLYDTATGGTAGWSESFTGLSFQDGYFAVTLGAAGTPLDDTMFDDDAWMGISVNSGPELGRLKVASVPYALRAEVAVSAMVADSATVADTANAVDWNAVVGRPTTISDISCSDGQVLTWTGTAWACGSPASVDASSLTGTIDIGNIPVGDDSASVAAGDHTHPFTEVTGIATAAQVPDLDASKLTSGQVALGRLPVGTGSTQVAAGDHIHSNYADASHTHSYTAADVGAIAAGGAVPIGTTTATCDGSTEGQLRYNSGELELCDGSDWNVIDMAGLDDGSAADRPALSCKTLHTGYPSLPSGTYWIDPNDGSTADSFQAYCDMTTAGGGWTRVVGINGANRAHRTASAVGASGMTTASAHGKYADSIINQLTTEAFRFTCNGVTTYFSGTLDADSTNQTNPCSNSVSGPYYPTSGYPSHAGIESYSPSGGSCNYIIYSYVGNGCWQGSDGRSGVVWSR